AARALIILAESVKAWSSILEDRLITGGLSIDRLIAGSRLVVGRELTIG
ncbi:6140_t:CDS:1, partial [Gigaspora margarita]